MLALKYFAPGQWFGGSVQSRQVHDMSGFRGGNIKLKIKAPAKVAFKIGIQDTYTNQSSVTFPANTTAYGLVRNGEWGTATIPVAEIARAAGRAAVHAGPVRVLQRGWRHAGRAVPDRLRRHHLGLGHGRRGADEGGRCAGCTSRGGRRSPTQTGAEHAGLRRHGVGLGGRALHRQRR